MYAECIKSKRVAAVGGVRVEGEPIKFATHFVDGTRLSPAIILYYALPKQNY